MTQLVALTCHGNAYLQGRPVPEFFSGNSSCRFCDSVTFVALSKTLFGKVREKQVAPNPNAWFEHLKTEGVAGVRLHRAAQNQPGISDRMSAGFVGGGGTWSLEAIRPGRKSAIWLSRWEVWNEKAPERRIWRVSYGRVSEGQARPASDDVGLAAERLRSALVKIHAFSQQQDCDGFTACFARAFETLHSRGAKCHGDQKDLVVDGVTPRPAMILLDACQSAWVFGGMGSWNDMNFAGEAQVEYDRVSEQLFSALNDAIQAAANASCLVAGI